AHRRGLPGRQLGGHRRRRRPLHPRPPHPLRGHGRGRPGLHRPFPPRIGAPVPTITMPQLGETVTEGTITRWLKQVGDSVATDELLFEVSTDKVDSEVPSPEAG